MTSLVESTKISGVVIKPETKQLIKLRVTTLLDGSDLYIPVHVIAGSELDPRLTVTHLIHGSEYQQIESIRRVVTKTDPEDITGTLIIIPVANPIAFGTLTRVTTVGGGDAADLNRVFPGYADEHGDRGWVNLQMARKITREVLANTDYLIDIHGGGFGGATIQSAYESSPSLDRKVISKSEEMAIAYGCGAVHERPRPYAGWGGMSGYAGLKLGIPNITPEIGGVGFSEEVEEKWIDMTVTGITNIMKHLGMMKGKPMLPKKQISYQRYARARPTVGGYLINYVKPEQLLAEFANEALLGTVYSPYSFEELEHLKSPCDGLMQFFGRSKPLTPGDYGYILIDLTDENTHWI